MEKQILIFFAENTSNIDYLLEELKKCKIEVVLAKTRRKVYNALKSKSVNMILIDSSYKDNSNDFANDIGLISLKPLNNIVILGNPKLYDLNKKHSHVTFVINKYLTIKEQIEEVLIYWKSGLILKEESERINAIRNSKTYVNRLEEDLKIKDRLISSLYLQLLEKNNSFNELYDTWSNLPLDRDIDKVKKMDKLLGSNINNDESWDDFLFHFVQVHPNFFEELKHVSKEDLSEENNRMCAYIKMGVSNKEIAHFLNILPNSVLRSQTRIKNKLSVSKKKSLRQFIRNL